MTQNFERGNRGGVFEGNLCGDFLFVKIDPHSFSVAKNGGGFKWITIPKIQIAKMVDYTLQTGDQA